MPPVRTSTARASRNGETNRLANNSSNNNDTTDPRTPKRTEFENRPLLGHMIISMNRHLFPSPTNHAFTCQFALYECQNQDKTISLPSLNYFALIRTACRMMNTEIGKDKMVVWRKTESGMLGRVQDDGSFVACVSDHQNGGLATVELFVVDKDDVLNLPEYYSKQKDGGNDGDGHDP